MKKIGIMTFHAAHNCGSVLQAYATQRTLAKLGYESEIINYRLRNQRAFYNHLYSARFGRRELARRLVRIPQHYKRRERAKKFEAFIRENLKITQREYSDYGELLRAGLDYDVLISGSDQVWNRHCKAEFQTEPPESILGYFLAFGRGDAARISFSSSLGRMTREEMAEYRGYLERYDHLSMREPEGAQMLSGLLDREVAVTLDPTLMLNREEWAIDGTYAVQSGYVLVYTLQKTRLVQALVRCAKAFADRRGLRLVCISPFSSVYVPGVVGLTNCGPLDFLSYMRDATAVITDSFHGSAFSINMERPFYTINYYAQEIRKNALLRQFGLERRLLTSFEDIAKIDDFECDFSDARQTLARRREESLNYLRGAMEDVTKGK